MKSSVIIFPGSNCDRDMDVALKKYGFKNHMVWHNDLELPKSDLVVLPGGFSYGDYLRCGSIAGKSKIIKSEGNYFCSDEELKSINENNQIALTYCDVDGVDNDEINPNGAIKNIAGVFNKNKNVLGMMPHPERMIDKYLSGEDGSIFFENLLKINN